MKKEPEFTIALVVPALRFISHALCLPDMELSDDDTSGLSFLLDHCCDTLEKEIELIPSE